MSTIFDRMRQAFSDQDNRHTYANGLVDSKLATQLKVLREQRGWTQTQLADKCRMQQARISVLEDVNYSSWSISTLRRIGKAFDLWLDVEWKEFGEVPRTLQNMSRETLERESFDDDPVFHESETASVTAQTSASIKRVLINPSEAPTQLSGSVLSREAPQQQASQDPIEERPFGGASIGSVTRMADYLKKRRPQSVAGMALYDGQHDAQQNLPQRLWSIKRRAVN